MENQTLITDYCHRLKHLALPLEELPSDVCLSSYLALSNVNISMYRLVSSYGLEDLLGTSMHYSESGHELLRRLEGKLDIARTVTTRARIILMMYRLNHETSDLYDLEYEEKCNAATEALYDDVVSEGMTLSDEESAYLCQCIAHYLYFLPEYDDRQQNMRSFFDRNISSWMSVDWICDFSPSVAISRLNALVCNSDMFMDSEYDNDISIMAAYLCEKSDSMCDRERFALYSLVSDRGSSAYMHSWAEYLSESCHPSLSEYESLYLQIDSICRKIENVF